jgi:hypothetical protein
MPEYSGILSAIVPALTTVGNGISERPSMGRGNLAPQDSVTSEMPARANSTSHFYHGGNGICYAVHPYGVEEKNCPDWQPAEKITASPKLSKPKIGSFLATVLIGSTICLIYGGLVGSTLVGIKHSELKIQSLRRSQNQSTLDRTQQEKIDSKIMFWMLINSASTIAFGVLTVYGVIFFIPALVNFFDSNLFGDESL